MRTNDSSVQFNVCALPAHKQDHTLRVGKMPAIRETTLRCHLKRGSGTSWDRAHLARMRTNDSSVQFNVCALPAHKQDHTLRVGKMPAIRETAVNVNPTPIPHHC
jgi:hypothetical protein